MTTADHIGRLKISVDGRPQYTFSTEKKGLADIYGNAYFDQLSVISRIIGRRTGISSARIAMPRAEALRRGLRSPSFIEK